MLGEIFYLVTFCIGREGMTAGGWVLVTYKPSVCPSVIRSPHIVFSSKPSCPVYPGVPQSISSPVNPQIRLEALRSILACKAWSLKTRVKVLAPSPALVVPFTYLLLAFLTH